MISISQSLSHVGRSYVRNKLHYVIFLLVMLHRQTFFRLSRMYCAFTVHTANYRNSLSEYHLV